MTIIFITGASGAGKTALVDSAKTTIVNLALLLVFARYRTSHEILLNRAPSQSPSD
jgi:hypothetical protein